MAKLNSEYVSYSVDHIPRNLIRYRRKKRMTQDELAGAMGMGEAKGSMICHWERGRREPSARHLIGLSLALEVPIDSLVVQYGEIE